MLVLLDPRARRRRAGWSETGLEAWLERARRRRCGDDIVVDPVGDGAVLRRRDDRRSPPPAPIRSSRASAQAQLSVIVAPGALGERRHDAGGARGGPAAADQLRRLGRDRPANLGAVGEGRRRRARAGERRGRGRRARRRTGSRRPRRMLLAEEAEPAPPQPARGGADLAAGRRSATPTSPPTRQLATAGNPTFLANAFNWLLERHKLLGIGAKKPEQVRLALTPGQLEADLLARARRSAGDRHRRRSRGLVPAPAGERVKPRRSLILAVVVGGARRLRAALRARAAVDRRAAGAAKKVLPRRGATRSWRSTWSGGAPRCGSRRDARAPAARRRTSAAPPTEWRIVAPLAARADRALVDGLAAIARRARDRARVEGGAARRARPRAGARQGDLALARRPHRDARDRRRRAGLERRRGRRRLGGRAAGGRERRRRRPRARPRRLAGEGAARRSARRRSSACASCRGTAPRSRSYGSARSSRSRSRTPTPRSAMPPTRCSVRSAACAPSGSSTRLSRPRSRRRSPPDRAGSRSGWRAAPRRTWSRSAPNRRPPGSATCASTVRLLKPAPPWPSRSSARPRSGGRARGRASKSGGRERVRIEEQAGKLELARSGGDWLRDGAKLPYAEPSDLLYALTSARAERVVSGAATAGYPTAGPELTAVLADGQGAEETLTLYAERDGQFPARVSGREVVLLLPATAVAELRAKLAAVRATKPLDESESLCLASASQWSQWSQRSLQKPRIRGQVVHSGGRWSSHRPRKCTTCPRIQPAVDSRCSPKTSRSASAISPSVASARTQSRIGGIRFARPPRAASAAPASRGARRGSRRARRAGRAGARPGRARSRVDASSDLGRGLVSSSW